MTCWLIYAPSWRTLTTPLARLGNLQATCTSEAGRGRRLVLAGLTVLGCIAVECLLCLAWPCRARAVKGIGCQGQRTEVGWAQPGEKTVAGALASSPA